MEYIYNAFVDDDAIASAEGQGYTINVRFCRDCPFFEIDGVQPFKDVTRGWCRRLSFEGEGKYTPHYIRVDTNSFCNDDHASRGDDIEIL